VFRELFKTFRHMWREPEGRGLILGFIGIITAGTVFYAAFEHWSLISALYFTVVMLTTVGFGDLHPTTDFTRAVTVVFIIVGVAFILGFLNFIMSRTMQRRAEDKYGKEINLGLLPAVEAKPIAESPTANSEKADDPG
jgi:voltage-gated potassium channel